MHHAHCYAALEPDQTQLDHSQNVDLPGNANVPGAGRSDVPRELSKHDRLITKS